MHIAIVGPANPSEFSDYLPACSEIPSGMGGVPVNALVQGLLATGHRVSLITGSNDTNDTWHIKGALLELFIVPFRSRARSRVLDCFAVERRHLTAAIAKAQPDVINAHWSYEFAMAAYEAKVAPVLLTVHDAPLSILSHTPDAYRLLRTVMAFIVRLSAKNITAVSPYLARAWRREMAYLRPVKIIPNSITTLQTDSKLRSSTPLVLGVGNDGRLKNYKALLRAFPHVLAQYPSSQLRLVGPGLDESGQLASWARQRGLGNNVTFVGPVDRAELAKEFSRATVFCHPSLEESFGMVLTEALQAGLPVVAGEKSGGVPWVLFDGQAGRLVNVKNADSIADGIISAIQDPSSTVAKGFDVASEIQQKYSVESITAQYLREYERVLSTQSAKG